MRKFVSVLHIDDNIARVVIFDHWRNIFQYCASVQRQISRNVRVCLNKLTLSR